MGDWVSGLVNPNWRADEAMALVDSAPCADPETQFKAAQVLEQGAEVEADPVRAYAWYAVAAARVYEPAAANRDALAATLSAYQVSEAGRIASTLAAGLLRGLGYRRVVRQSIPTVITLPLTSATARRQPFSGSLRGE